jgi:hypothetical protein
MNSKINVLPDTIFTAQVILLSECTWPYYANFARKVIEHMEEEV